MINKDERYKTEDKPSSLNGANSRGTDHSLASHGCDPYYLYSVKDVFILLTDIRKKSFGGSFVVNGKIVPCNKGEEYIAHRANSKRVFIADPYHVDNFANSFTDDISKIVRSFNSVCLPVMFIIPIIDHIHWRVIRIQIDYNSEEISILWDDPYGAGKFGEGLKTSFSKVITKQISYLFSVSRKRVGDSEGVVTLPRHIEVEKVIDQQGRGENGVDCGPIVLSNIRDYVNNPGVSNKDFAYRKVRK